MKEKTREELIKFLLEETIISYDKDALSKLNTMTTTKLKELYELSFPIQT